MKIFEIISDPSQRFMELVASTFGGNPNGRLFRASSSTNIELKPYPPNEVYIAEIYTRPDMRGSGEGTKVLVQLCAMADETGTVLSLLPSSDDTEALRKWYATQGFVGDRKMIRQPR